MNEFPSKLKFNKSIHLAIRQDVEVDLTALRVGKLRVARKKKNNVSNLKAAIYAYRGQTSTLSDTEAAPTLDSGTESKLAIPEYIGYPSNTELDDLSYVALKELARLQSRGNDQPPEKRYKYKRFVVGFREVERALRRGELKGVIIATNLEVVPELHSMVSALRDECTERQVPVIFSLTRRRLGKAVGKSMKQSLVGIVSLEGVHQVWKQIISIPASLCPDSFGKEKPQ
jgi:selenocysteine insertion sequence-binding protein 2